MAYVVTENCIRCQYMDCVEACPVDCFHLGAEMLVIDPESCIDCGVCEPACPATAIQPDDDPRAADWLGFNQRQAATWPLIGAKGTPPADADAWNGRPDKRALLDPALLGG